jgi:hypothetical protein
LCMEILKLPYKRARYQVKWPVICLFLHTENVMMILDIGEVMKNCEAVSLFV